MMLGHGAADWEYLHRSKPCGPTGDEVECACGCSGYDDRCPYWGAVYKFTQDQVCPEHRCCQIPGRS